MKVGEHCSGYEPVIGATLPISRSGSGVNAFANLSANSITVVGEGASVIVPLGLVLCTTTDGVSNDVRQASSRKQKIKVAYTVNSSVAYNDILSTLV